MCVCVCKHQLREKERKREEKRKHDRAILKTEQILTQLIVPSSILWVDADALKASIKLAGNKVHAPR